MKQYLLTEKIERLLLRCGKDLVCAKCKRKITPGDELVASANRSRYYHKTCWEALFLE